MEFTMSSPPQLSRIKTHNAQCKRFAYVAFLLIMDCILNDLKPMSIKPTDLCIPMQPYKNDKLTNATKNHYNAITPSTRSQRLELKA